MGTQRGQVCSLHLVYPPISNQEAEWVRSDADVQSTLKTSNFYMIGRRAEARFEKLNPDVDKNTLEFDYVVGGERVNHVTLVLSELLEDAGILAGTMELEVGDKLIRIWTIDENGHRPENLLIWFTTESLLFDCWRGRSGIYGLEDLRDFARYELLYAGISKRDDAFERLLNKPHDKRLRILANENQITEGARVTDETYLFFFELNVLRVHTYDVESQLSDFGLKPDLEDPRILADAEKAFVSFIQSRYNTIKYQAYPKGRDGLFDSDLDRYCYVIGENLTFHGPAAEIVGGFHPHFPNSNDADFVLIEGDEATLIKAADLAEH